MDGGAPASSGGRDGLPVEPRRGEERRVVTALFCDLVGFTAHSEHNDPEVVDAFSVATMGSPDGWSSPTAGPSKSTSGTPSSPSSACLSLHEDDPERASGRGCAWSTRSTRFRASGPALEVRVGVNTGEALVRLDVDPGAGEGFLTGDAVNVAARLQSAAPPMAVATGEATHAATERIFAFEACHPVDAQGQGEAAARLDRHRAPGQDRLRTAQFRH